MRGERDAVEDFMHWIGRQVQATFKIFTVGNHDLTFDPQRGGNVGDKPEWLKDILHQERVYRNVFYLENGIMDVAGVKIWASPTSAWFRGDRWAFNLREKEAEELYSTIPQGVDILVTHGPAYTYGDWAMNCACYVGDHALLKHVKRVKPLLHLFGHIHESYGYSYNMDTHFFNGCNCTLQYEIGNEPWLIEADFDEREIKILNQIK